MSVRINLLPDAKQAKVRETRTRQLAAAIGSLVVLVSLGSVVLLLIVLGAQKFRLSQLNGQIKERRAKIESYQPELGKALTTQRHLASLPPLWQNRVYLSKIFGVLQSLTPTDLALNNVDITPGGLVKMSGRGANYSAINKFTKALEQSNLQLGSGAGPNNTPYFTDVRLEGVTTETDGKVSFIISANVSSEVTNGR